MVLDVIRKFEGRRVRVVYDQTYPAMSLVFNHIVPEFREKRLIVGIYSDTTCRVLKEQYKFLAKNAPDVAKILDRAYVVKIGRRDIIPFGKLYQFIHEDAMKREFEKLEVAVSKLDDNDLLLLFGFYLMYPIYGRWVLKNLMWLADLLPERLTLISLSPYGLYDFTTNKIVERFFDVVVRIVKEEEPLDFGEDIYIVGVEESVTRDIKPGFERYKMLPDGSLSKL